MKDRLLGIVVTLAMMTPLGCLSGADLTDVVAGDSAEGVSVADQLAGVAAAEMLTGVFGGESDEEVSKREFLAVLIELFAVSADATGSEAIMWDLAASAARDGRTGVQRSVAEFVAAQVAGSVASGMTPIAP